MEILFCILAVSYTFSMRFILWNILYSASVIIIIMNDNGSVVWVTWRSLVNWKPGYRYENKLRIHVATLS